jgi:hypothetical protein
LPSQNQGSDFFVDEKCDVTKLRAHHSWDVDTKTSESGTDELNSVVPDSLGWFNYGFGYLCDDHRNAAVFLSCNRGVLLPAQKLTSTRSAVDTSSARGA